MNIKTDICVYNEVIITLSKLILNHVTKLKN